MSASETWRGFRPLPEDIQEKIAQLPTLLEQEGALLAYLFGSLAQSERGQDVDLALLMPEASPPYQLWNEISDFLGTERLDIVDLRRASPVLRFEVLTGGRCLYAINEDTQQAFEEATIRLYQDTNYLRRQQERLLRERHGL